jgi:chromosome segregation ATPase
VSEKETEDVFTTAASDLKQLRRRQRQLSPTDKAIQSGLYESLKQLRDLIDVRDKLVDDAIHFAAEVEQELQGQKSAAIRLESFEKELHDLQETLADSQRVYESQKRDIQVLQAQLQASEQNYEALLAERNELQLHLQRYQSAPFHHCQPSLN